MNERCDYCGPLNWTINAYGQITHKCGCPHKTHDRCQAHPRGCDDHPAPLAFEWKFSKPIPQDVGA